MTKEEVLIKIGVDSNLAGKIAAYLEDMDKDLQAQFWLKFIDELEKTKSIKGLIR